MVEKMAVRNAVIVLACLIILGGCLYFAIKLISNNSIEQDEIGINNSNNNHSADDEIIVSEIIDGDTFRLQNGETIRLLCVDTPEKGQVGYDEATNYLGSTLLTRDNENTRIILEGNKTDKYNRSLRWVWIDFLDTNSSVLINKEIIDKGYGSLFDYEGENCSLVG